MINRKVYMWHVQFAYWNGGVWPWLRGRFSISCPASSIGGATSPAISAMRLAVRGETYD